MSQNLSQDQQQEPEVNAVSRLIKGRPTQFQLDLLQLGRELNWDENDPGFAVPLSMGQIENVLDLYPARIKAAMEEISQQSESKWRRTQSALEISALRGEQAADRMDNRLAQVKGLLDLEISQVDGLMQRERLALQTAMADERKALQMMMADERMAMMLLAQELAEQQAELLEQQKRVLEEETKALVVRGVRSMNQQSTKEMKKIVAEAKKAHYLQAVGWACGSAFALIVLTLLLQALVMRFS